MPKVDFFSVTTSLFNCPYPYVQGVSDRDSSAHVRFHHFTFCQVAIWDGFKKTHGNFIMSHTHDFT